MSTTETALSVHLVVDSKHFTADFSDNFSEKIKIIHHISHVTIQLETKTQDMSCEINCN